MKDDGELVTVRDRLCLGQLREPWHEVCEETPTELNRRLQIQNWNDRQRVYSKIFDGLDPVVWAARQRWRKLKRDLRHARKS